MMLNLKNKTKRTIFLVFILYLVGWALSLPDLAGRTSNLFCGIVTVILVFFCLYAGWKAIFLAHKIDKSPVWYSHCCCKKSAMQVVYGYSLLMFILALLKSRSIGDIFVTHWSIMPPEYHMEAWAYLSLNGLEVIMALVVLGIFEEKYKCAQHPRHFIKDTNSYEICP